MTNILLQLCATTSRRCRTRVYTIMDWMDTLWHKLYTRNNDRPGDTINVYTRMMRGWRDWVALIKSYTLCLRRRVMCGEKKRTKLDVKSISARHFYSVIVSLGQLYAVREARDLDISSCCIHFGRTLKTRVMCYRHLSPPHTPHFIQLCRPIDRFSSCRAFNCARF